jgi:regulator of protease activity HflC (stomatin/prohibitin superfamily)
MNDILKIAIGVFIGALAAAFTWEGIQTIRVEIALKKASEEMKRSTEATQARLNAQQQTRTQEQQRIGQEQQANAQRAAESQLLDRQRIQDKAEAFKRFYKPTTSCAADPVQMDCANAHIKAKTIFESQYVPIR